MVVVLAAAVAAVVAVAVWVVAAVPSAATYVQPGCTLPGNTVTIATTLHEGMREVRS